MTPMFHIRCLFEGISPPVWRSLQVPGWMTFHQLRSVLAAMLEWQDGDAYRFLIGRQVLIHGAKSIEEDSGAWKLMQWFQPGLRFTISLESGWTLSLQVAGLAEGEPGTVYPRCIGGEQASPPEDVGGPAGYARLLKNPKQRGLWNPERFDLEAVNLNLAKAAARLKPIRLPKQQIPPDVLLPEGPGVFLQENDVQFDLHAYFHELETAYWNEPEPKTIKEALSCLKRDELLGLCMVYGIVVEPAFRRLQVEAMLARQLPEAIRLQVPYLDDRQYGLLRQVVDNPDGTAKFEQAEMLFSPYELYYFRDRLLLFPRMKGGSSEIYMLPEVREALQMDAMQSLSRTQLQNANRRRIIAGMYQYYGVLPMEELQALLSELLGETIDLDTVIVDVQELQDFCDAVTIGETLVMHTALDPAKADEIWFRQGLYPDLPYKKPSLETLDLAGEWMFVEVTNEAEILISFLEGRYGLNTGAAEGMAWELMHRFRWGEPLEQTLTLANRTLVHPDEAAEKRFGELVSDLWQHAPAWRFKGWSPAEIHTMELHPERAMSWLSGDPDESGDPNESGDPDESGDADESGDPDESSDPVRQMSEDKEKKPPDKPPAKGGAGTILSFPAGPRKPKRH